MNVIEGKWCELEEILEKRGINEPQRIVMAQSFFGGAYAVAKHLADALDRAETPEQYVGEVNNVLEELMAVQQNGVPVKRPKPNLIILPSSPEGPQEGGRR